LLLKVTYGHPLFPKFSLGVILLNLEKNGGRERREELRGRGEERKEV
jgi:hypothetical protein